MHVKDIIQLEHLIIPNCQNSFLRVTNNEDVAFVGNRKDVDLLGLEDNQLPFLLNLNGPFGPGYDFPLRA